MGADESQAPGDRAANPHEDWRVVLGVFGSESAFGFAFPRLAYRLRWATRLRGRGLLAYVAYKGLVIFVVRTYEPVLTRRFFESMNAQRGRLREQLGREPSEQELARFLAGARR